MYARIILYQIWFQGGSFLSDIGGILGLYLGFSVMTIMEFVEISLDIVALVMFKLRKRRSSSLRPLDDTNNIESDSQEMSRMSYDPKKSAVVAQTMDYYYAAGDKSPLPNQIPEENLGI